MRKETAVVEGSQHVALQAARVLDHLQLLSDHYGQDIVQSEPELARAIVQAIDALNEYVSRTGPALPGSDS